MSKVVVITGASAGVGRATSLAFAENGYDVALIARNQSRLDDAAAAIRRCGRRALPIAADVADCAALDTAATHVEQELGPIDVWVNNAMATIFAPVGHISADEFRRATEVTYLGQVHGSMAALARMRPRDRGRIVNVGSALAYRAVPLQSAYCGAKYAVRGFTDALRTELMHDRSRVHLTMVHLPAMNTPQFDWALNRMGRQAQPIPPVFQPEVAARAILFAAEHRRREVWVGMPTVKAIIANRLAPWLLDRILARRGYTSQLAKQSRPEDAPANLFHAVPGAYGAHGRFDGLAHPTSPEFFASRHRGAALGVLALAGAAIAVHLSRRAALSG